MRQNGGYEEYEIESLMKCKTQQDASEWEYHLILECNPPCNVRGT